MAKQTVHVRASFTDSTGDEIGAGFPSVDSETAARWIKEGRASELPHKNFRPGIWKSSEAPKWVAEAKAAVAAQAGEPAIAAALPADTAAKAENKKESK